MLCVNKTIYYNTKFYYLGGYQGFIFGKYSSQCFYSQKVVSSSSASQLLINDCIAPISSMADSSDLCIPIGKYKRPCFIFNALSFDQSKFPTYFISTRQTGFPALNPCSYPYCLFQLVYFYALASNTVFTCYTKAYIVHLGITQPHVQLFYSYSMLGFANNCYLARFLLGHIIKIFRRSIRAPTYIKPNRDSLSALAQLS